MISSVSRSLCRVRLGEMVAMKRLLFAAVLAVFGLAMPACTTTLGLAGDSWIGAPVDEFIVRAGVPQRAMMLQDGRMAYTWNLGCEVTLIAKDGIIQDWSSTNCLSIHPIPGRWKR